MDIEQARFNMIEQQVRPWNVADTHVLELLGTVRREDFVLPEYRGLAFADLELPLKPGAQAVALGQVMLPPRVQARLLQDLRVARHEKALEIGSGSGFMAALLGHRAQSVLTLEIDPELAQIAHLNLQRAGALNVQVRMVDGARADLSSDGPFDVIVLSGSVAQLPDSLVTLLRPGGRLLAIVGEEPVMRATLVEKGQQGTVVTQPWDENIPRLLNFPELSRFRF
jgi:protein-L-isoaspartate(D-aspartate) O-methyltransferase